MRKTLNRDIVVTLIIKLSLLFVVWFFCFKNTANHHPNTEQWFFGTTQQQKITNSDIFS